MRITHEYKPRAIFAPFHSRWQRWALLVAHRRAGKTVATINDTISRILYFAQPRGRFAYIAPYYSQAKKIAWSYVKMYTKNMLSRSPQESELTVQFAPNNAQLSLYGADNPDSFRGQYFDGVILDEYGDMRPSVWSEVILPTLIDRRGWATFIGTPNGPNHFRDLYLYALEHPDDWFVDTLPVSLTNLIPEEELSELRRLMLPEEYEQEMECSFEASTRGAFYASEIKEATDEGRVGFFPPEKDLYLHFVFDIGRTDDTAMVAWQEKPDGCQIVHSEAQNAHGPEYWSARINTVCMEMGVQRGAVWLPHDAKAKTFASRRSVVEQFVILGIRPNIVPDLGLQDGISAARWVFRYVRFHEPGTDQLILALKSYHRRYDEDKKAFTNDPVHDWSSHPADAFRYFALAARFPHSRPVEPTEAVEKVGSPLRSRPMTLEGLYADRTTRVFDVIR